jgi:hypothetical protein
MRKKQGRLWEQRETFYSRPREKFAGSGHALQMANGRLGILIITGGMPETGPALHLRPRMT